MTSALASRIALASKPYNSVKIKEKDMSVVDAAVAVMEQAKREIFTLRARVENLENELIAISAFAVGNGDVCEIIANRARRAVLDNSESLDNSSPDTLLVRAERLENM